MFLKEVYTPLPRETLIGSGEPVLILWSKPLYTGYVYLALKSKNSQTLRYDSYTLSTATFTHFQL